MKVGKDIHLVDRGIMLSILGKEVSNCCLCFFHFDRCVLDGFSASKCLF
jgi:hypothetical protein